MRRLVFIRHARDVGFSLEEIADLLRLGPAQDAAVAARIIESKLLQIEGKLVELEQWRYMLRELHQAAASSTTLTQSIIDFFESEVRGAMARLPQSSTSPGDSHDDR